jgi:hypothetical protein
VVADGTKSFIKIDVPDHPLTLAFEPNGSLDPGAGPYQVHGRIVTGQNDDGDFTFVPLEQTCNLAVLAPSKTIPSGSAADSAPMAAAPASAGTLSLSIVSGFPAQPGVPNPLAGHPYILLRDSFANVLAKGGVSAPSGMSPYKFLGSACMLRTPDCQRIIDAVKANTAANIRADANGSGTFSGLAPGTYYLMISTRYNNQPIAWDQAVQVKPGSNSITLDQSNATPIK